MNIDQIIGKMMGDGSIGEEKAALDSWKKEAEDNIKALEDIKKIAALSNTMNGYQDFDTNDAWAKMEQEIANPQESAESVYASSNNKDKEAKVFRLNNLTKIAAAVVLLIGAIFAFNSMPAEETGFLQQEFATNQVMENHLLPDGTKLIIDKDSKVRLNADRTVSMKGRAFFNVAKDPNRQFTVKMPVGNITVLGTRFTVKADDATTDIYVEEGKVRYQLDDRTWTLVAGDLVRVSNNNAVVLKNSNKNYNSWKDQRLIFDDNSMIEVIDALSKHYDRDIKIVDNKLFSDCNVKTVFDDMSIEEILNELNVTHGLKFEIEGEKVTIVSSKC